MTPRLCVAVYCTALLASTVAAEAKDAAPTVKQALALKPIQKGVEYDTPASDEISGCTIKAEREGKSTSWIVRDAAGSVLRRFADANADNVVDTWCYYAGGLEVYRDVDSDFDSRADQYRWAHTGGTRIGIDSNEDTKIDRWQRISPQEVAEEAFNAVQSGDSERFSRLLLTATEAKSLGLGESLAKQFAEGRKTAASDFKAFAAKQQTIDSKSRFVDFGAPRPGVIPRGVDGSTKDVVVYENASALIDAGGAPEQLLLGSLVQVGDGWRLVEAPKAGEGNPVLANLFSVPTRSGTIKAGVPSDSVQKWMSELDQLDRKATTSSGAALEKLTDRRVAILEQLAAKASNVEEATAWYKQLAGLLTASVQADGYTKGVAKLAKLERSSGVRRVGKDLEAHFRYQRIAAEQGLAFRNPKADYAKVQEKWISDLEGFVKAFPTSTDAAEALLQLGSMAGEFAGEDKVAEKWYRQAAAEFGSTPAGKKAAGALRRMQSVGKTFSLSGNTLSGRKIATTGAPYKGRFVLVHYWTTWGSPETDIATIEAMRRKYRGKLEVVGVNLDNDPATAKSFASKNGAAWEHLYDAKGLDGDRAAEMGVVNLPLMILLDSRGRVVNRGLHSAELAAELKRVIR